LFGINIILVVANSRKTLPFTVHFCYKVTAAAPDSVTVIDAWNTVSSSHAVSIFMEPSVYRRRYERRRSPQPKLHYENKKTRSMER